MPELADIQKRHFDAMTPQERDDVIRDSQRQMDVIAFSPTDVGEKRRAELQARIDYCKTLKNKPHR